MVASGDVGCFLRLTTKATTGLYFWHSFFTQLRMHTSDKDWDNPGGSQNSVRGGSAQKSNPLPFYIPFLSEKVPFRIPSINKWYPFHTPSFKLCISFNCCKRNVC